jgi:hypothetical protein
MNCRAIDRFDDNVKANLCHADIWGSGDIAPSFFILAIDGGEWSASCPSRFTPREIALSTHCMGGTRIEAK